MSSVDGSSGPTLSGTAEASPSSAMSLHVRESAPMVTDDLPRWPASQLSAWLQQSLARASREDRLVRGFQPILDQINRDSSRILLCVLPENLWCGQTYRALFSLLLAACHQAGVRMIKVDQDELVRKILAAPSPPPQPALSHECLAILNSCDSGQPFSDSQLAVFYDSGGHGRDFNTLPIINLLNS